MWVNPHHPNPPQPAAPPDDDGQELATLERKDGSQLRIRLKEYRGSPFVWIQPWTPGPDGVLWPQRGRGASIKISEIADVIAALRRADDMLDERRPSVRQERSGGKVGHYPGPDSGAAPGSPPGQFCGLRRQDLHTALGTVGAADARAGGVVRRVRRCTMSLFDDDGPDLDEPSLRSVHWSPGPVVTLDGRRWHLPRLGPLRPLLMPMMAGYVRLNSTGWDGLALYAPLVRLGMARGTEESVEALVNLGRAAIQMNYEVTPDHAAGLLPDVHMSGANLEIHAALDAIGAWAGLRARTIVAFQMKHSTTDEYPTRRLCPSLH